MVIIAGGYALVILTRPFAALAPNRDHSTLSITTPTSSLPWPNYGEAAFGLLNGKVISTHGEQTPLPTASTAKVITALVVLSHRPLAAGSDGPTITLNAQDVAIYDQYVANHGSVVAVHDGQQLSERQMLEAILLPSANNLADSLAIWAYGSLTAYRTAATSWLAQHDLNDTHIGSDASGLSPDSTSSTTDLVKLGALAMQNPALASVVAEKVAIIPGTGVVHNYNTLLGNGGIVGIKTGNSDQNTGVFVGAANVTVSGKTITLITAVSGGPSLATVLRDSNALLAAAQTTIANTTVIQKDDVLGTYHQPSGQILQAVAASTLSTTLLRGDTISATVSLKKISYNAQAGQVVGTASLPTTEFAPATKITIVLKQMPTKPSVWYRLTHP